MEDQKKGNGKTTNEQKSRVLEYQHFDLRKVKIDKNGANVDHHEGGSDAGIVSKIGETTPHPDLQKSLDALKAIMARRLGLLEGTDIAREISKGDLAKYELALNREKEIINRCNVNGLTFTGSGDKFGVMITGSVLLPISGSVGLAVSKIAFNEDSLGYEKEVEQLCEKVKVEVYAYRFQNKKAQLDIEFEASKFEEDKGTKKGKKGGKSPELI